MSILDSIKRNTNILDVIAIYAPIKKVGSKLKADPNPLRDENTSSFIIYPDTQRYYDFGSGMGGDVVDFIQEVERLSDTREAISFLQAHYMLGEPLQRVPSKPPPKPIKRDDNQLIANLTAKADRYLADNPITTIGNKSRAVKRWIEFTLSTDGKESLATTFYLINLKYHL